MDPDVFVSDFEEDLLPEIVDPNYTYDEIDLDQVIMAVDEHGLRRLTGEIR